MLAQLGAPHASGVVAVREATRGQFSPPWCRPVIFRRLTATSALVSRSIACSALWARCVRPSLIFVIRASLSVGLMPLHLVSEADFVRVWICPSKRIS